MLTRILWVALAAGVALAGCSASREAGTTPGDALGAGAGMGPGISVAEALASRAEPPFLVNGWLWAQDAEVRLCSSLSGSTPPQCVAPSLAVRGLDLATIEGLRREGGAAWSQEAVQLLGEVSGGVLTVSALSKG